MALQFKRATKKRGFARMAFIGPAGTGKTYSALAVATVFARTAGKRVAVIDTEHESATLYADVFDFDHLPLETYDPRLYVEAIRVAERAGHGAIVIDSLTHAWSGKGGALDIKDRTAAASPSKDSFAAWRTVTPIHNELIETMLAARCHVLVTMRAKTAYEITKDERGKNKVEKLGLEAVQREGLEYEFDIVGVMDENNAYRVTKTRCSAYAGEFIQRPGQHFAEGVLAWLNAGAEDAPAMPAPPPAPAEGLPPNMSRSEYNRATAPTQQVPMPAGDPPPPVVPPVDARGREVEAAVLGAAPEERSLIDQGGLSEVALARVRGLCTRLDGHPADDNTDQLVNVHRALCKATSAKALQDAVGVIKGEQLTEAETALARAAYAWVQRHRLAKAGAKAS